MQSGIRVPWTLMPIFIAPVAGILSDRIGARPLMATGLALQAFAIAWLRIGVRDRRRVHDAPPGLRGRRGRAWRFRLRAVRQRGPRLGEAERGRPKASGATNTIRELGGVLGVAVLATVFSSAGGYGSPAGVRRRDDRGVSIGAAVLAVGALVAARARHRPQRPATATAPAPRAVPPTSPPPDLRDPPAHWIHGPEGATSGP